MIQDPDDNNSLFASLVRPEGALGFVLTFLGVLALALVLYETYSIFTNPAQLAGFDEIFSNDVTISWNDGFITLPPELLVYFFPLSVLSIASGIGRVLLSSGIDLIRKKTA
jgi:hypothetical protein